MTPLHRAAGSGQLDTVQLLIKYQADINAQDKYGNTPLHYAASHGFANTVRYLIIENASTAIHNRNNLDVCAFVEKHHPTSTMPIFIKQELNDLKQYMEILKINK